MSPNRQSNEGPRNGCSLSWIDATGCVFIQFNALICGYPSEGWIHLLG